MLYFLTGNVQTGKTRWLMRHIEKLEVEGTQVCGVVAPGVWKKHPDGFEKLGIDNLLLPEKRLIPFARRDDLARPEDKQYASQSEQARLHWVINDDAIAHVNEHFDELARIESPGNRILVVDELGRLELEYGAGLTSAVALVDRGATPAFPHAIVVVRAELLEAAKARFANAPWNGMQDLLPR